MSGREYSHRGVIPSGLVHSADLLGRPETQKLHGMWKQKESLLCKKIRTYIDEAGPIHTPEALRMLYRICLRRIVWAEEDFLEKFRYALFEDVVAADTVVDTFSVQYNNTQYSVQLWRRMNGAYEIEGDGSFAELVGDMSKTDALQDMSPPFEWRDL